MVHLHTTMYIIVDIIFTSHMVLAWYLLVSFISPNIYHCACFYHKISKKIKKSDNDLYIPKLRNNILVFIKSSDKFAFYHKISGLI